MRTVLDTLNQSLSENYEEIAGTLTRSQPTSAGMGSLDCALSQDFHEGVKKRKWLRE